MRNLLEQYKEISIELLSELRKENLNIVFKLSEERQQILYKLSCINVDKNIDLEKDFGIFSIDKEISDEINRQKLGLKNEMEELKRQKVANSVYGKQFENIYFVNRHI